jgi:hypothetical protein
MKIPKAELIIHGITPSHPDDKPTMTALITSGLSKSKLYFVPQEFLLKNQILSVLISHFNPGINYTFDTIPARELIRTKQALNEWGYSAVFRDMILKDSFSIPSTDKK